MHLHHANRTHTPYISFTSSPSSLDALARRRSENPYRGPQTVTAIDPRLRIGRGLPVLHAEAEMNHCGIPDPYRQSNDYYQDHYVCLWQVTEVEIIGEWEWNDLARNLAWYEEIVLPAYNRGNAAVQPKAGKDSDTTNELGALQDGLTNLSITCSSIASRGVQ